MTVQPDSSQRKGIDKSEKELLTVDLYSLLTETHTHISEIQKIFARIISERTQLKEKMSKLVHTPHASEPQKQECLHAFETLESVRVKFELTLAVLEDSEFKLVDMINEFNQHRIKNNNSLALDFSSTLRKRVSEINDRIQKSLACISEEGINDSSRLVYEHDFLDVLYRFKKEIEVGCQLLQDRHDKVKEQMEDLYAEIERYSRNDGEVQHMLEDLDKLDMLLREFEKIITGIFQFRREIDNTIADIKYHLVINDGKLDEQYKLQISGEIERIATTLEHTGKDPFSDLKKADLTDVDGHA